MSSQTDTSTDTGARPSDAEIQSLLARAVRLYAERAGESERPLPAFPVDQTVTATDVVMTVTAMLKAVNLQVFELGMWQAWAGKQ